MITTIEKPQIEQVISQFVTLRKAGKNLIGLCPLHSEKTPSFTVDLGRQRFKCFGCGESGDVIDFSMKYHGTDFRGALSALGISSDRTFKPDPVTLRKRQLFSDYLTWKKKRDDDLLTLHRVTLNLLDASKEPGRGHLQRILKMIQAELAIFDSRDDEYIFQLYKREVQHG